MSYILIEDSNDTLPISLDDLKNYLRLDGDDYDNILLPIIFKIKNSAELITGRDLLNKTWQLHLDRFCNQIKIKRSRLQEIISIRYYINGVLQTLSPDLYYFTKENDFSSIYFKNDLPSIDNRKQAVEITFISGYGNNINNIPNGLKYAMLQHAGFLFQNTDQFDNSVIKQFYYDYIVADNLFMVI